MAMASMVDEDLKTIDALKPINPYGLSKHFFDRWALAQKNAPPVWAGFKFFNVYGPGEYHKGEMRSLVAKAVPQIQDSSKLKLFRSHRDGVAHGMQKRDFVYIKDVIDVLLHFFRHMSNPEVIQSGHVYNVGTGSAESFLELGTQVFNSMDRRPTFDWIDMPERIRNQYQYFTQASIEGLRDKANYRRAFMPLREGVKDYVQNYLLSDDPYL